MSKSLEKARKIIEALPDSAFRGHNYYTWRQAGFAMAQLNNSDECRDIWLSVSKRRGVPPGRLESLDYFWEVFSVTPKMDLKSLDYLMDLN